MDVKDFSENGHIQPKREGESRIKVLLRDGLHSFRSGHLEDFDNIRDSEREELRSQLSSKRLPLAITEESRIVISGDLSHDPAAIQHFNDKLLKPYIH